MDSDANLCQRSTWWKGASYQSNQVAKERTAVTQSRKGRELRRSDSCPLITFFTSLAFVRNGSKYLYSAYPLTHPDAINREPKQS